MSNSSQTELGNPLLYSLPAGRRTLEPYWVIIGQMILIQFCQRLWNRVRYKTWFLQLEIVIMRNCNYSSNGAAGGYNFEIDFFDAFQTIWVTGHFVWYCILQGSCMSAANASNWRCFNFFGYVLMNYVAPSAISLAINIYTKAPKCQRHSFQKWGRYRNKKSFNWIFMYLVLCSNDSSFSTFHSLF